MKSVNDVTKVDKCPGIYRFWFDGLSMLDIWNPSNSKKLANLKSRCISTTVNDNRYFALYVGIDKDLRNRLRWHIDRGHPSNDHHSVRCVSHSPSTLSTLRQTLSALLRVDMTKSEKLVDDYMDRHCFVEWIYTGSHSIAKVLETLLLSPITNHIYPLNIDGNNNIDKGWLRKQYKNSNYILYNCWQDFKLSSNKSLYFKN